MKKNTTNLENCQSRCGKISGCAVYDAGPLCYNQRAVCAVCERMILMKKTILCLILMICTALVPAHALELTDAKGRIVELDAPERVVALLGSYGEVWLAAGGCLAGTTEDSVDTPAALAQGGIADLGSHVQPNMETLFALDPDFAILSADTPSHLEIAETLESAGVPCAFFSMNDYRGYMELLKIFTDLTGRTDLFEAQIETVEKPVETMIANAKADPEYGRRTALLLRAFSTNVKAKDSEGTVAGPILKDMGLVNLADGESGLSENLSLEAILMADPDYIFVVTMGADPEAAWRIMEQTFLSNPAWNTLTAVRENHVVALDKELFHLRPNARWAEAYQFIEELLYGAE